MDIDLIYENVITTLTRGDRIIDISSQLLSLDNNADRVLDIYETLKQLKVFPVPLDVKKSTTKSVRYRNLGNKEFQKSREYEAWQLYNMALSFAPMDSDDFMIALSNRSAVLCSIGKYEECVKDIEKVFAMNYPERLKDKLTKRLLLCKEALSNSTSKDDKNKPEIIDIHTIKGARNRMYPCATDAVDVVYTKEMGRHLIANRDIEVGEVIAEENPYVLLLLKTQCLFCCSYCLSRAAHLLPCPSCCYSLYCSDACKENAYKDYHRYECSILATLIAMNFTKLELLALRTVIKARTQHTDWPSLYETIDKTESQLDSDHRGCIEVNGEWIYTSTDYPAIHALETNIKIRSISDIFRKGVTAAVYLHILQNYTDFMTVSDDKDKVVKCVAGLLLHHIMTCPTNMHGISTNIATEEGKYVNDVNLGSAPYAFLSLLNHSCSPNVARFSTLGTGVMRMYTVRFIKKGMQIYDNYGVHHALDYRQERRESLQFQYKFFCRCEACTDNWPTYQQLKGAQNLPDGIKKEKESVLNTPNMEKLEIGCVDTALAIYRPLCGLVKKLEDYAPCQEFSDCQEALKQCLVIFDGVLPYGYSKLIQWNVCS